SAGRSRMKWSIWSAASAALVIAIPVALLAQNPPPQPPSSMSPKTITITGCVQRSEVPPAGVAGAAGTSGSSLADTKFVLKNAAASPSAAPGSPGTPPSASTASEYRLDTEDAKLTPHVGHKVEITGTVEQASSMPPAASTQPSSASTGMTPKIKVDS